MNSSYQGVIMQEKIKELLQDSVDVKVRVKQSLAPVIERAALRIIDCYKKGGKLIIFGNGGSAADAQHIAGELVHQFELKGRKALPAIALNTNSSIMTAIGNDWGFDRVFERQVEALANKGDVVIGISTSGNAESVLLGLRMAKSKGAFTIALTGKDGGKLKEEAELSIVVPSNSTARIQESHITIGHIICHLIEAELR